jgi:hypothetical protein
LIFVAALSVPTVLVAAPLMSVWLLSVVAPPGHTVVADAIGVVITGLATTVYVTVAVVLQSVAPSLAETVYTYVPGAVGVMFAVAPATLVGIPLPATGEAVQLYTYVFVGEPAVFAAVSVIWVFGQPFGGVVLLFTLADTASG